MSRFTKIFHLLSLYHRLSLKHFNATGKILPIGSAICVKCDPNNLNDGNSKENVHEGNAPNVATQMTFPHSTMPQSNTGSFCNSEKLQMGRSNKGIGHL